MKPPVFHYHAPTTLDECVSLLARFGNEAALLAGGQSLVPMLRFRVAQPAHVISIRGLHHELETIRQLDRGVEIGAAVTYIAAQRAPEVVSACPDLSAAIDLVAHPSVRTRGTLGGNLCQADPASELPAVALVMDARFKLRSVTGERELSARDFFQGPYETARRPDEILTGVIFPRQERGERLVVKEVTRLRGGFPMAGVAILLQHGEAAVPRSVAVACFGSHYMQIRLPTVEAVLTTRGCTAEGVAAGEAAIAAAIQPHSDPFASAEYRRAATQTLFRRAIGELSGLG